jgi:hypothetical protein
VYGGHNGFIYSISAWLTASLFGSIHNQVRRMICIENIRKPCYISLSTGRERASLKKSAKEPQQRMMLLRMPGNSFRREGIVYGARRGMNRHRRGGSGLLWPKSTLQPFRGVEAFNESGEY